MHNRLKITLIAILFSLGLYFLIRQTVACKQDGRGDLTPKVTQTPVQPINQPQTVSSQPGQTQDTGQTQGSVLTVSAPTIETVSTSEIDLNKIVWLRDYLKKYIGKIKDEYLKALNDLLQAMQNQDQKGFENGMNFLALHYKELVEPLIDFAQDNTLGYLRAVSIELLGRSKDPRAIDPLVILSDKIEEKEIRSTAIQALAVFDDERSEEKIFKISADRKDNLREIAITLIGGKYTRDKTKDLLLEILHSNPPESDEIITAASYSLRGFNSDEVIVSSLKQIISDSNNSEKTRGVAMLSLAKISPSEAIPFIERGLKSNERVVRFNSVMAASFSNNDLIYEELYGLLINVSEFPHIRNAAAKVIEKTKPDTVVKKIRAEFLRLDDFGAGLVADIFVAANDIDSIDLMRQRSSNTSDTYLKKTLEEKALKIESEKDRK
ncbi:MAG: hypothetical protein PHW04_08640 [Candidatus Wallbacteria bacterium]|nr:hypothetical protein [Candidatus Wallbacteria bacterium]